ncbi:unnamed protein product [Vicia faba]|uniref:Trichome birefringence-like C-terminal domain-containing protein n=1 Tax=Vicia faba TaxID=3906 RepID=A0AAV0YAK2_VICFA|nr:unnamed protein product [Vicia faba]
MQPLRRKAPLFNSEIGAMKGRKNSNLSIFVVVFSIFLFGIFMYNEDVKSIAEFPFSRPKVQETHQENSKKDTKKDVVEETVDDTKKDVGEETVTKSSRTKLEKRDDGDEDSDEHVEVKKIVMTEKEEKIELLEEEEEDEEELSCHQKIVICSMNWKWQPRDCSMPKFKPRLLFKKIRGKRSVVPSDKKTWYKTGSLAILKIEEPENIITTVEFYWSPFLVESNSDDPNMHSILNRIIMPESIEKHGVNWKNADYLIFNTYIWWMNTFNMKVSRGSFDEGATEYDEVPRPEAYERVMRTWSKWVDEHIDPNRTKVFFTGTSPLHIKSEDWNNPDGIKCAKEITPVLNMSTPLNVGTDRRLFVIANNVTKSMKVPVYFINITTLSEYRKDAHTSVYTIRQGKMLTPEQQADPTTYADCIHWCLPGLPDIWNEFLYTQIISQS